MVSAEKAKEWRTKWGRNWYLSTQENKEKNNESQGK
jgi:hypothetical protein